MTSPLLVGLDELVGAARAIRVWKWWWLGWAHPAVHNPAQTFPVGRVVGNCGAKQPSDATLGERV